jgi:hypothetical protein
MIRLGVFESRVLRKIFGSKIPTAVNLNFLDPELLLFHSISSSVILTRLRGRRSQKI